MKWGREGKELRQMALSQSYPVVLLPRCITSIFVVLWGFVAVVITGEYPSRARDFVLGVYRYGLRVQAYVALRAS
jgi:hypothetical protein